MALIKAVGISQKSPLPSVIIAVEGGHRKKQQYRAGSRRLHLAPIPRTDKICIERLYSVLRGGLCNRQGQTVIAFPLQFEASCDDKIIAAGQGVEELRPVVTGIAEQAWHPRHN